ncbi:MAG: HD domain-containing protein [Desulfobulbaceae bacterium]|nr:HD domain-containing protein [Desulfobulbaceae bacterium]
MEQSDHEEKILELIVRLNVAITNIRLFPPRHHNVSGAMDAAHTALATVLQRQGQLDLAVVGDDLIANGKRLPVVPGLTQLVAILQEKSVDHLNFHRNIREKELHDFIATLASHEPKPLRSSGSIRLGRMEGVAGNGRETTGADEDQGALYEIEAGGETILDLRGALEYEVKDIYQGIKEKQDVELHALNAIIANFAHESAHLINPLKLLAEVKSYDEYTYVHMVNVCTLTMSQAESLGFEGKPLREIGLAAALHDVGKLFIPDEIINKPGRLTPEERAVVETHPLRGVRHLMAMNNIPTLAMLCALEHHMRWDGKGYPAVEEGWQPHIVSQMIAVADVFDAMRSKRPYSPPHPQEIILAVLEEGKGALFNPVLVDNFLKIIARVQ